MTPKASRTASRVARLDRTRVQEAAAGRNAVGREKGKAEARAAVLQPKKKTSKTVLEPDRRTIR